MADKSYPVITSFQIVTATKEDYEAHRSFDPTNLPAGKHYKQLFAAEMGYNPGSKLGTRQECPVCGRSGPECIGHPFVMNMSSLGATFLSEFGIPTIASITSVICTKCKTVVSDKDKKVSDLEGLLKLSKQRYMCNCPGSTPSIDKVKEEKISEADKTFEWRDGRKREKKRPQLTLTMQITELKKLIEATDLTPLKINKENVLNLFYNKLILMPTSVQPMNFRRTLSAGVDETTKMVQLYAEMARFVIHGNMDELETKLRSLAVGAQNDRYSGTPSHLMVCDGKKGLFRGPATNKRSIGTGRAVLTPNIYGRSGELLCPEFIMKNLQYKYRVAVHNKEYLQSEVGKSVTHLVIPIESSTTNMRDTYKKLSSQTMLKLGDIVLKTLTDGDFVVFWRNPTLWRHGLVGYPVKGWTNYCLAPHETNTPGHGADYDGDEGNLAVGADLPSRIETQMMAAMYHLFSGRSGEPIIGIYYNGIVGAFALSTDDNIDDRTFTMLKGIIEAKGIHSASSRIRELVIDESYYRELARKNNIPYRSGRILISMLFPRQLNYTRGDVVIKGGLMLKGSLKSADVSHGLIVAIAGVERWRAPYMFVDRGYAMMSAYISTKGLTITARDYVMPGELEKQILPPNYPQTMIDTAKEIEILEASKSHKTKASVDRVEELIDHKLDKLKSLVTDLLKEGPYHNTNNATISYMSGARGNVDHIAQTVACVGQVYAGSSRYDPKSPRSSYYVKRNSTNIFDRGFVRNCYVTGMKPSEVMGVANAARGQALNTFLGVPISGATSTQVTNHQADIHASESLSTCKRGGSTLDCLYGYGCDSTMVTHRKNAMGELESSVDPVALLDMVNES